MNLAVGRDYAELVCLIRDYQPDTIVHFAEQRAAPYSMKSARHKRYTVTNNLNATNDVCAAIVESELDVHLVHLGTMGVYGYSSVGLRIPEGYLPVKVDAGRQPGGYGHPLSGQSRLDLSYDEGSGSALLPLLQQERRTEDHRPAPGHRVGDCRPGRRGGEPLINRFDYDGDYGTVLNRFLMQAAVGHPLTVHGSGGQTRAFIHIQDTVRCIQLACENPPQTGERVNIFNQATETHRVRDLARLVSEMTGVRVMMLPNPREELDENELEVANDRFLALGLKPQTMREGLLSEVTDIARRYKDRVDTSKIMSQSAWNTKAAERIRTGGRTGATVIPIGRASA